MKVGIFVSAEKIVFLYSEQLILVISKFLEVFNFFLKKNCYMIKNRITYLNNFNHFFFKQPEV